MRNVHTHYDNLKVARDAPPSVIKAAYRVLSQEWHPDKSASPNSERIMVLINRSYEVLSDPDQRRAHDTWITEQEAAAQQEAVAGHERAVEDEPAWTEQRPFDEQGGIRYGGIPARLWVVIAVSLTYLAFVGGDKLFAGDQAAETVIQVPATQAGTEAASVTATGMAELPVPPSTPGEEPAAARASQPISEPAPKHVSVDKGSADEDAISPVEGAEAKKGSDAAQVRLLEPVAQRYAVQVATLATQAKVDELQTRLRAAGISSYTEPSATGDLIRVRIGPYSRDESQEIRSKLIGMGLTGTLVPL